MILTTLKSSIDSKLHTHTLITNKKVLVLIWTKTKIYRFDKHLKLGLVDY